MMEGQRFCPVTKTLLTSVEADGVRIDYSPVSGGIWFDNYELRKFDEPHEEVPAVLLELVPERTDLPRLPRYECPVDGTPMQRHVFSYKQAVEIDECPLCGGIWLDWGELGKIRELYPDAAARQMVADEIVEGMLMSNPQVKDQQAKTAELQQRAGRVANVFRFLSPQRGRVTGSSQVS